MKCLASKIGFYTKLWYDILGERDMDISVIITTFNRKYEVRRAIETVYEQTIMPCEVIVVDDASLDGTKEYLESFNFQGMRYFRLEQNVGVSVARNYGVSKAKGDYIAFLDSDNEWCSGKIEFLQKFLENMTKPYDIIGSHYIERKKFDDVIYPLCEKKENYEEEIWKHNIAEASASLYKKSTLQFIGGFNPDFQIYADWELILRLMEKRIINIYLIEEIFSKNWTMYNSLSENRELLQHEKDRLKIKFPKLQFDEVENG